MKKKYTFKILTVFVLIFSFSNAQTTLYLEGFDNPDVDMSTYQLYDGGNNAVAFATTGTDYIVRATPGSLPLGEPVSGISGKAICLEDYDGAGFFGTPYLRTNAINTSGYADYTLTMTFAAPRGSLGFRYETGDYLDVDYRIDGGAWSQAFYLQGSGTPGDNFYYTGLDNTLGGGDDVLVNNVAQTFSRILTGTGNTLEIRITMASQGSHEEMIFDDIKVEAATVLGVAEESVLSKNVSLSPNPVKEDRILNINNNTQNTITGVEVYDVIGKKVFTKTLTTETIQFPNNIPSGMYFVKITDAKNNSVTKKVILE